MCTVTILPEDVLRRSSIAASRSLRLRLVCNRDELFTRAAALPPVTRRMGPRHAVMPVDPESGGTWIAANDAGLVFALLNVNAGPAPGTADLSRGTIIPALLPSGGLDEALLHAQELSLERYEPFRLLIVEAERLVECVSQRGQLEWIHRPLLEPLMRTSSGLGDDLVQGPRQDLFRAFLEHASDPVAAEDLFHVHQWRGREAISVRMRRHNASTVSHTVVEVSAASVSLSYRPAASPDGIVVTMAA